MSGDYDKKLALEEDPELMREVTAILRRVDEAFQESGGGTRAWLYLFFSALEQEGFTITKKKGR